MAPIILVNRFYCSAMLFGLETGTDQKIGGIAGGSRITDVAILFGSDEGGQE